MQIAKHRPRKYRAERRNAARGNVWCGVPAKIIDRPAVRPNERDRSRPEPVATLDFTGRTGLVNSFINHSPRPLVQPKPKRGWAAARRRAPFADAFSVDRMAKIAARHVHPRSKRVA